MADTKDLILKLTLDNSKFKSEVGKASNSLKGVGSSATTAFGKIKAGVSKATAGIKKLGASAKKAGQTIKKNMLASGAAFLALGASVKKALDLYAVQEKAEKTLGAAMKQAGTFTQAAYKHNLEYASSLQQMTTFGDEAILGVQKQLTNFGAEGKVLDDLTKATLDLAAAKGIDLKSAGDLVSKSFGSSTNAMSRYGIEVTGAAGSTERAEQAVQNITKLFGGAAAAEAATFGGIMTQVSNSFGDFMETVGKVIAKVVGPLLSGLNKMGSGTKTFVFGLGAIGVAAASAALAFGPLGVAIVGITALVFGLTKGIQDLNESLENIERLEKINDMWDSIKDGSAKAGEAFKFFLQRLKETEGVGKKAFFFKREMETTGESLKTLTEKQEFYKKKLEETTAATQAVVDSQKTVGEVGRANLQDLIEKGKRYADTLAAINAKIAEREQLEIQNKATVDKFLKDRNTTALQKKLEEIDGLIELEEIGTQRRMALEAVKTELLAEEELKRFDEQNRLRDEGLKRTEDALKREMEMRVRAIEAVNQAAINSSKLINGLTKNITDIKLQGYEKEKAANQKKFDDGLITEEAFLRNQEKIDRKMAEQKTKAARAEKAAAIASSIINTAIGVSKAIAASPFTGGLPGSAIALASGAVQTGIISSQPIPTFAQGGIISDVARSGMTPAGEDGLIAAQRGEAVLNKSAVTELGESTINALNNLGGTTVNNTNNVADGQGAVEVINQFLKTQGGSRGAGI